MFADMAQGFLLGVSTGAFCLGTCAPAMLPYAVAVRSDSIRASVRLLLEFLFGRLVAYLILGTAAVCVGIRFQTWSGMRWVTGLAMALLALSLIGYWVRVNFIQSTACRAYRLAQRVPFYTGLLIGLSPCPPLILLMTTLLVKRQLLHSAVILAAFFLATTAWTLPVILFAPLSRKAVFRRSARMALVLSGLWFLVQGFIIICA